MEADKSQSVHSPGPRHGVEGERFNHALFSALDALDSGGIPYALIGGVASSGLGRPRTTHDIDIFVRPEDAEDALESLDENGFKTEKTDPMWLYKGWKEGILVDVIFKSSGDIYFDEEMRRHCRNVSFHNRQVKAVSPEDLIIIKCAVHNEVGPHHWHDALAILAAANIDWNYLLRRARRAARRLLALLIYAQSNDIWVPNWVIYDLFNVVFEDAKVQGAAGHKGGSRQMAKKSATGSKAEDTYLVGRIKDALAHDTRTGEQDVKIIVGDHHVVVRGEASNEFQKEAIEEVIENVAPDFQIDNQMTLRNLPGPEGAEFIV